MIQHRAIAFALPLIIVSAVFLGVMFIDDDHDSEAKTCSTCGGSGKVTCSRCGGNGYSVVSHSGSGENYYEYSGCTSCGGSGSYLVAFDGSSEVDEGYVEGSGKISCSTCGGSGTVADPHTHSYSLTSTSYGKCSGSVKTYTCSCGDSYTSGTKYDSHNYKSQGTTYGTCSGSQTTYKCSRCGDSYSSGTIYNSHNWGSWTTTKAATCTDTGTQKHTCSRCSTTATQTISALGHSYVNHSAVSATCISSGNDQYYSCSRCSSLFNSSKTVISSIPTTSALGHSYSVQSYFWTTDHSKCTVSFECSRDSSHTASYVASSTSSSTTNSDVLSTKTYAISGTYSGTSYSSSYNEYTHSAILKYDANGGTGAPSQQSASVVSSSSSPSGSSSFAVGSAPTYSGKVFGSWNDGSSDHAVGSSISVPYGSIVTLNAVWEDTIMFTTVPTASCIVTPVIDYSEDGSYVLKSKADLVTLGAAASSESATWTDPNYREPPEADHVITITDKLSFASNDPAYVMSWAYTDSTFSGVDDASSMKDLINAVYQSTVGSYKDRWIFSSEQCLPSWIVCDSYGVAAVGGTVGGYSISIYPALQQVSENTHGEYWIYYSVTSPANHSDSWLIRLSVDVEWAGGVIVPEKYSVFILRLDYGFDGGANNKVLRQVLSADATEFRFPIADMGVSRDGYIFKGWSMTAGSKTTDIGEEFPLNIGSAAVMKGTDDSGNTTYTCTIYAVWEEVEKPTPVIPDDLRDILNLLQDPAVLALFILICFLVAVVVRVRRQGMY